MRWRIAAIATSAAVGAAVVGGVDVTTSAPAPAPRCEDAPGKTLAATERYRVLARVDDAYVCARGSRRMLPLGAYPAEGCFSSGGCPFVHGFRFAGRYIAYAESFHSGHHDFATTSVHLADMKRYETRVVFDPKPRVTSDSAEIGDIAVTKRGSVAFIIEHSGPASTGDRRVRRIQGPPPGDEVELLDSGVEIELDSLAESGGRLYWTNAGAPRSAPID